MTTVLTRVNEIFVREAFSIVVRHKRTGNRVQTGRNGILGPYPFSRKYKGTATVAVWRDRFEDTYPSYTCDVLKTDGTVASGQTLLDTVRDTY